MNRRPSRRTSTLLLALAALLGSLVAPFGALRAEEGDTPATTKDATPAPAGSEAEDASMQDYLEMEQASQPFRAVADSFVAAAARGDAAAVIDMLSPNLRAQAGEETVASVITGQVLPFFSAYGATGNSVTISQTSDQFGSAGFAYHMWMEPKDAGAAEADAEPEPRPFVLYVLQEGERIIVGNVLVDHYVEGRHQ